MFYRQAVAFFYDECFAIAVILFLMINRRHLRVKILQCLYAFYQSHNQELDSGVNELMKSIEKVYDLYLYQFTLLVALVRQEEQILDERQRKHLPTEEDLHPNKRFINNKILRMLEQDATLEKMASARGIHWQDHMDLVRNLLKHIKHSSYYNAYMQAEDGNEKDDLRLVIRMIERDIVDFEPLHYFYEEKSIYWIDDWELIYKMMLKTLRASVEKGQVELMTLFKDPTDRDFAQTLFQKAVLNHEAFNEIISQKTKNWDVDRIALMDMIIMEMALTEILKFPEIPVKVSLNEYIELSKMYSTPKSKVFVNGVLDKLLDEFVKEKKIVPYKAPGSDGASE